MKLEIFGLVLPEVDTSNDLVQLLVDAASQQCGGIVSGDILVITSKIVSKSRGLLVALDSVEPSEQARKIVRQTGGNPRLTEVILDSSDRILAAIPIQELEKRGLIQLEELAADKFSARQVMADNPTLLLVERGGQVYSDAGLDASNHPPGIVSLPPADPNGVARELREAIRKAAGVQIALIISDTEFSLGGGSVDVARGAAGFQVIDHGLGRKDRFGRPKFGAMDNIALELASAAGLVMGQAAEGIPAVLIRGFRYTPSETDHVKSPVTQSDILWPLLKAVLKHTLKVRGVSSILRSIFSHR